MRIFVAGLNHRTAPVELREQLAVSHARLGCHGCRLKIGADLGEVVLLSTCNRVEVYGVSHRLNGKVDTVFRHLTTSGIDFRPMMYVWEQREAVEHLFRVTSGLDSMVLGETEITGQVKQAYETARQHGLTGPVFNRLFQKAFHTAKQIRTRTAIGRGATSVGSVAVELAEKIFGQRLADQTVMIIGAGAMGESCVRHLARKGARSLLVSNRSFARAEQLAAQFGGRAVRFDDVGAALCEVDIVVSSTGCPKTILQRADIEAAMRVRGQRPLFLIDIAVPRDIAPEVQQLDNVYLYNIDDLEAIVRDNVRAREQELAQCRAIIEQQTAAFLGRIRTREHPHEPAVLPVPAWTLSGASASGL